MIDFKYLTTVMHEFRVFGKNKENKEISLLKKKSKLNTQKILPSDKKRFRFFKYGTKERIVDYMYC